MASRPGRPLLVQDWFHAVGRMWVVNVWDQGQDGGSGDVGKERRRGGEGRGGEGGSCDHGTDSRDTAQDGERAWRNVERRVLSAPRPFHTIRVICGISNIETGKRIWLFL